MQEGRRLHRLNPCVLESITMLRGNVSARPRCKRDKTGETDLPSASELQPDKTDINNQIFIT